MTHIIVIANQKGGVAKTTTTASFAAALTRKGFHVLAVDMDPQGNLSDSVGASMYDCPTAYELLKNEVTAGQCIQHADAFDIIPANIMLAGAEQELSHTGKEYRLKERLSDIVGNYDYIIIDTPPSLGILTVNAFTAAHTVIIPTTAGIFAAKGIQQLYNTVENVRRYCNPDITIAGILFTRYNPRAVISQDVRALTEQLGNTMQATIYKTFIRNSVVVEEAQANQQDIFSYKNNTTVAEDYDAFVKEYMKSTNKTPATKKKERKG